MKLHLEEQETRIRLNLTYSVSGKVGWEITVREDAVEAADDLLLHWHEKMLIRLANGRLTGLPSTNDAETEAGT